MIGFLSAFLGGAEIEFFRSVFLETTAIASIVHRVRAPMLLAQVAVFLDTSFLRDSGTVVSTRLLCTLFIAVRSFLVARSDGPFGSFLVTYALDCLERQKEQLHVFSLCKAFSLQEATDLSDLSWPHTCSIALRDRRSEHMSTGVPPFS